MFSNIGEWSNDLANGMMTLEQEMAAFGEKMPEPKYRHGGKENERPDSDDDDWMTPRRVSVYIVKCLFSVSQKNSTVVFWHYFPDGCEFLIIFIRLLYGPIYTRLQIFIQLSLTLTKLGLCHIKRGHPSNALHFTRPSMFAYWANDVTVDVMLYPTCLLTLYNQQIWDDLPQTMIRYDTIEEINVDSKAEYTA